mgnify:CR=1 FL=1
MKRLIAISILLFVIVIPNAYSDEDAFLNDYLLYLDLTNANKSREFALHQMILQYKKLPKMDSKKLDEFEKTAVDEIKILNRRLFPVFKKYFSHSELQEMIKFYRSPIGRKLSRVAPELTRDSTIVGIQWGQEIEQRIFTECKK